jgi:putative AlgH/UPF0301 family transcriptional regulator
MFSASQLTVTALSSIPMHKESNPEQPTADTRLTPTAVQDSDDDWRKFRAKLVGKSTFESKGLIEQGSLVISLVEDSWACHDLYQPYLHKAVVLLLQHDPSEFTQGILLNRPTDLELSDDDIVYTNAEDKSGRWDVNNHNMSDSRIVDGSINTWPIMFGGDLAGPFDEKRQAMICYLHRNASLANVSDIIMSDFYVTSHATAKEAVAQGSAHPDDFVCFYGFCGWEPGQLQREIYRGSWTMVATTTDIIWEQIQCQRNHSPMSAGLDTWEYFQQQIGLESFPTAPVETPLF